MGGDLAQVRGAAVLEQVDALPGSERHPAADNRDRQTDRGQSGADMGRHVVRPLVVVGIAALVLGRQELEERLEIVAHRRRGVLLDQQRRRGMTTEQGQQSGFEPMRVDPLDDVAGELIGAATAGSGSEKGGERNDGLGCTGKGGARKRRARR